MNKTNLNNGLNRVKELFDILSSTPTPIDLSSCIAKLKSVLDSASDQNIRIVLLGSFADGKTSTIAGLMGEVMDDMKIDSDESSDELVVYRPQNLKKGYIIIDTPGLFGTKEREINGENVQLSDMTIKFISEAHIVMYVTSAVAPVKESHSAILRKVLRDLGKLDSTIFVLNKMDETGANITNDESYHEMAQRKKRFLVERLESIINLTQDEARKLKVVCISADPKRKGIQNWLETPERYNQLSRIGSLQSSLNSVLSNSDKDKLRAEAYAASLKDVMYTFACIYNNYTRPLRENITIFKEDFEDLESNLNRTKNKLIKVRGEMIRQLDQYRKSILQKISECSYEEMGTILQNDIGVENNNVTYYVVEANVNAILNDCAMSNESSLSFTWTEMKAKFEKQDEVFQNLAGAGIEALKKVDNKVVLAARDIFCKGYKFKPWGAVKVASKVGKVAGVLQVIMAGIELFVQWKRNKDLKKTVKALSDVLSHYFTDIYRLMASDEDYINNFAPAYQEMVIALDERKKEAKVLENALSSVEALKSKVSGFYGVNIEDVEFEELI